MLKHISLVKHRWRINVKTHKFIGVYIISIYMGNANEVFDNWPNKYNYCNAQYTPLYLPILYQDYYDMCERKKHTFKYKSLYSNAFKIIHTKTK